MSKKRNKDDCTTYYAWDGRIQCLHQIFQYGQVDALTRQKTPNGTKMYIWHNYDKKAKYQTGGRSQIKDFEEALLAVDLAKKYNVRRIEL